MTRAPRRQLRRDDARQLARRRRQAASFSAASTPSSPRRRPTASPPRKRPGWHARPCYGECEVSRFYGGPIDEAQGRMNEWPIDESFIDYTTGNPTGGIINDPHDFPQLTPGCWRRPTSRAGIENLSTGFHAHRVPLVGAAARSDGGAGRAAVHRLRRRRHGGEPGAPPHLSAGRDRAVALATCSGLAAAVGPRPTRRATARRWCAGPAHDGAPARSCAACRNMAISRALLRAAERSVRDAGSQGRRVLLQREHATPISSPTRSASRTSTSAATRRC